MSSDPYSFEELVQIMDNVRFNNGCLESVTKAIYCLVQEIKQIKECVACLERKK